MLGTLSRLALVVAMVARATASAEAASPGAMRPAPDAEAVAPADLDVELTLHEVVGADRRAEVCSTGVPLPCGCLRQPEGIALFDSAGRAVPAQFRVLERWRNRAEGRGDGSIRWLLVTFLADAPAGRAAVYRLRAGRNPPPTEPLRPDDLGDAWRLGSLIVKKDLSAPWRFVLTDPDGKEHSAADLPLEWSVEESGPLRARLKAESPTVPGRFGLIVWLDAYAGLSRWDLIVVLKNTPQRMQGPLYFKDFSVIWQPPALDGASDYHLGARWGKPLSGRAEAGDVVRLHQESDGTEHWAAFGPEGRMSPVLDWTEDKSKTKAARPGFRGYRVTAGDRQLESGDLAAGWAALEGRGQAAFAAVRDYAQQYPKATDVTPGRIQLRLWPQCTASFGGLHWLDDCTRKWHDLTFRVAPAPLGAAASDVLGRAWDFPLVAHAPAQWYLSSGAVERLPQHAGAQPFAGAVVDAQKPTGRNWVNFGGDVTDQIRRRYHGADLGPFARTGDPAEAYRLYNTARHSSGMTPLWLDDYQYPRDVDQLTHDQYCGLARAPGDYRPGTWHHGYMTWNAAHFCCQEVFDNWRLRGDPLARDALVTIGRWCQAYVDFRESHPDRLIAGTRADGLPLYNLCEAYRILGDESMRPSLERFAEVCWRQVDKQRGNYGVMDSWEGGQQRCEKPFMMAQVIQGLRAYWELTACERTADQIYGMADFILQESSLGPWGFNYVVLIDPEENRRHLAARRAEADRDGRNVSYGDLAWVMAWVHRHFGDGRFREAIDRIDASAYPYVSRAYTGYYPERDDREPPGAVADLAAEPLGGGRVRLKWTAPSGEPVRYQVKWAEKPMVERLRYPDECDTRANWWAAEHVAGEPPPSAPGRDESMIVEGIPPGKRYFAVRSFDAASNRSALGNIVEVEVR